MKEFSPSLIKQLTENVSVFIRKKGAILFNRLSFNYSYLPPNLFSLLEKKAKEMEKETPDLKFQLPTLKKIRVEVNFTCNLACEYCLVFKNQLYQLNEKMSLDTAENIVAFYKNKIKEGSVMITGGEPFLNWPIVKFFIKEIKDPIKVFTNGTILTSDILSTLEKSPHVRVMVSLDGQKKDNKLRKFKNGQEVYYQVIKNIKILKKKGVKTGIASVCLNHNIKHLFQIVRFFYRNLSIDYMGFNFPHFTKEKKLDVDMEEYAQQMIKIFDFAIQNRIHIDQLAKRFSPLITKKFRFYACKLSGEQITFYPDGAKTLCTKIDSLDNPKKYDLEYFKNVIPINNKFCKNCPAIGICGGGCFWDGIVRFEQGVDERECILNRRLLDYFLWKIQEALKRKYFSQLLNSF